MAVGILCLIVYMLLAVRNPTTFDAGPNNLLLYVGIVALPLGLLLLWSGVMKDDKK
jgi:uncharacterized integral membrane protein